MREMKDSGVDSIGFIPFEWRNTRLKYLCSITTGDSDTQDATPKGKYPFYVRSPIVERSDKFTFEGDGILIAGDGAGAGRIFHRVHGKYAVHQRVYRLYDFKNVNIDFIYHYLESLFPNEMDRGSAQSTVPSIRLPMLTNLQVALPPIEEQSLIVSFVSEKVDAITEAIARHQSIIEKLEEYKKSVITHTVTKGFAAKEKEKINSSLSDKWQYRKIKTVVLSLTDGTHGTFKRISKGEPLLSAKNVFEEGLNITDSESMISEEDYNKITANGFPHKGDVLLCCVGTVGRTTVYPYERPLAFQRSVIFMTPNTNIITSKMLNYALMSNDVYNQENRLINQAAQAGLYQGAVREIYIYVPPLEIQDEITDFLDSKCSKINESIERSNKIIQKLEEYKKSLIYNAVTGKIDCRNA